MMTRAIALIDLAADTRGRIEALRDEDPEVLLAHFGEVEQTLANFQSVGTHTMGNFLKPLQPAGLHSLKMCGSVLSRHDPDPQLPEGHPDVDELVKKVRELIAAVSEIDGITSAEARWLIERLEDVEIALHEIGLRGAAGVEQAFEQMMGGLFIRPSLFSRIYHSPAWRVIVDLAAVLQLAIGVSTGLLELTSADEHPPVVEIHQDTTIDDRDVIVLTPPASSATDPDGSQLDSAAPPIPEQESRP
jgi:hypothetical protein